MVQNRLPGPVYRVENDRPVDFTDGGNASVEYHGVDELAPALRSCVFLPDSAVTRHNERRVLLVFHVPRERQYDAVLTFQVSTKSPLTKDNVARVFAPSTPWASVDVGSHTANPTCWCCRIHFRSDLSHSDTEIWVDPQFPDNLAIEEIRFNRAEVFDVTDQPT
jgi:hypothetical protein